MYKDGDPEEAHMNIPSEMTCHCRVQEVTETDTRLAEKFGLDPFDVHRFMDEWEKVAGQVARERARKNASTSGRDQG